VEINWELKNYITTVDEKSRIQNQNMVQQKTTQSYAAVRKDQFTEKKRKRRKKWATDENCRNNHAYLPPHFFPFPMYPRLHVHFILPFALLHTALVSQPPLFFEHTSITKCYNLEAIRFSEKQVRNETDTSHQLLNSYSFNTRIWCSRKKSELSSYSTSLLVCC